jgi:hypothetical protein
MDVHVACREDIYFGKLNGRHLLKDGRVEVKIILQLFLNKEVL